MKQLKPIHKEIARRLICGQRRFKIAEELEVDAQTVTNLQSEPLFIMYLQKLEKRVDAQLVENRTSAQAVLEASVADAAMLQTLIMKDEVEGCTNIDIKTRQRSAMDILDRIEGKPVQKSEIKHTDVTQLIIEAYQDKHGSKTEYKESENERVAAAAKQDRNDNEPQKDQSMLLLPPPSPAQSRIHDCVDIVESGS